MMKLGLHRLTVRQKLLCLPALFLLGLAALLITNLYVENRVRQKVIFPNFEQQIIAGHKVALQAAVQSEAATLAERLKGLKTREERVAAIVAETEPIRFFEDRSGYFFTYDMSGVRINVPINKSQNGKNLIDAKDEKGFPFIKALVEAAKAGGGFVNYHFQKEGKGVQPKLSYAVMIPGTDFMVGTGVYIDNVEAERASLSAKIAGEQRQYRAYTIGLFVLIMTLTFSGSLWLSASVRRSIQGVTDELSEVSSQVHSASEHVSSASQSLAEGASEQAASLEETSASLEELSSMTRTNAQNAHSATELAGETRSAAERGAANMKEVSDAMTAINASSNNIAQILKTIDEIAFQTNILALNAAVEAARAGEAGMGFAVVADEVRSLAQRCAQSARETAAKIDEAIRNSQQGVAISAKAAGGLQEIVSKARQMEELVVGISGASNEQSQGISQVNTAVSQMDKVTQSSAAIAEETAASAAELNSQAAAMQQAIAGLLRIVGATEHTHAQGVKVSGVDPKPQGNARNGRSSTAHAGSGAKIGLHDAAPAKRALISAS